MASAHRLTDAQYDELTEMQMNEPPPTYTLIECCICHSKVHMWVHRHMPYQTCRKVDCMTASIELLKAKQEMHKQRMIEMLKAAGKTYKP